LALFFSYLGIPFRQIHLNGHIVAEYYFDNKWNVIDGDQNIVYQNLDNRSLASFNEITKDPFIAIRTKPYGKYRAYDFKDSIGNGSLFEYIHPNELPMVTLSQTLFEDLEDDRWTLYPGEKLIFHYDQSPEKVAEKQGSAIPEGDSNPSLGLIELVVDTKQRIGSLKKKSILIQSRYPVYKITYHKSGKTLYAPKGRLYLKIDLTVDDPDERISVFSHGTRYSFPSLSKGRNEIILSTEQGLGEAKLSFIYDPPEKYVALPRIEVKNNHTHFRDETPYFILGGAQGLDKIWWQISETRDFHFILPNFERIQDDSKTVTLSQMTDTFFKNGGTYFFRVKGKRETIWGPWSSLFRFTVEKPEQPGDVHITMLPNNKVKLTWRHEGGDGADYLIFGSNRIDFIPELYTGVEVVQLMNREVLSSRPNKNLIATTKNSFYELQDQYPFYRIVAKRGKALSTPSVIIRPPNDPSRISKGRQQPMVLQSRWTKIEKKENKTGYKDIYWAKEMPLEDQRL
jgi:hypothetical protein